MKHPVTRIAFTALWITMIPLAVSSQVFPEEETLDVVYIDDGSVLRGRIIENFKDRHVIIEIFGGSIFKIAHDHVIEIAEENNPDFNTRWVRVIVGPEERQNDTSVIGPVGEYRRIQTLADVVRIPFTPQLHATDGITVEALFRISEFRDDASDAGFMGGTLHPILSQSHSGSWAGNYAIGVTQTGAYFMFEPRDSHYVVSFSFEEERWYHIAATHTFGNPAGARIYIDGDPIEGTWVNDVGTRISGTDRIDEPMSDAPLLLGAIDVANPTAFSGNLDEVRVWTKARTQREIQTTLRRSISEQAHASLALSFTSTP